MERAQSRVIIHKGLRRMPKSLNLLLFSFRAPTVVLRLPLPFLICGMLFGVPLLDYAPRHTHRSKESSKATYNPFTVGLARSGEPHELKSFDFLTHRTHFLSESFNIRADDRWFYS